MIRKLLLCTIPLLGPSLHAQTYCSPTFQNGCSLWRNLTVNIGTINWSLDVSSCNLSDYTSMSTNVTPGVPEPMSVTSGNWTGCAVWVDLNSNQAFEDAENLYYSYVGGDPSYAYNFTITIPPGTPAGSYRMRVVAPWGSDGFLNTNVNGYGPCGAYQYGNFDDFTVVVGGSTSVAEAGADPLPTVGPNPTDGHVLVTLPRGISVDRIAVLATDGRMVLDIPYAQRTGMVDVDLGGLEAGMYLLRCYSGATASTVRVLKH